ncbi:MAG: Na(+)-translocating NADH-quinone reductase subunit A [Verrucomicrobiales bacterium]|nr:Na(+)-translocating NADH-quinone reductase subunit A [Verrucomicrobiales bacterium]
MTRIRKGLDLPLSGPPDQAAPPATPLVSQVALLAGDYPGMKPTLAVSEGDPVTLGQVLFTDKRTHGVRYTAPAAGTVSAINRGEKRKFESLVIQLDGDDSEGADTFSHYPAAALRSLDRTAAHDNLIASGLWTALRTRPFNKVPAPGTAPAALFVTAIDTEPLAPDPLPVINARSGDFTAGIHVLSRLTAGPVYICKKKGAPLPVPDGSNIHTRDFAGPHPAGLPGTHIHFLHPAGAATTVWHIGYQDVLAVGHLFLTGQLDTSRSIALAGPSFTKPRLVKTRIGASIEDLARDNLITADGNRPRVISGSPLNGHTAAGHHAFLGRFHRQVTALPDESPREFLSWLLPGFKKFSSKPAFLGAVLNRSKPRALTTSTGGSPRAMVPVGAYENVMPLDILPTQLLRALASDDDDEAAGLGALELAEDDLALCSYVCPGKEDWGTHLRNCLDRLEKDA